MKAYKLTDRCGYSRNYTLWEVGKTVYAEEKPKFYTWDGGPESCQRGVLHAYYSPELAVLFNPIHCDITEPRMFEVDAEYWWTDGCKRWTSHPCKVIREMEVPILTPATLCEWVSRLGYVVPPRPVDVFCARAAKSSGVGEAKLMDIFKELEL